jgi:enoyl-CoA hydratase/carnithine racemase
VLKPYKFLDVRVDDGLAVVSINRPERLNTLHPPAHREFEELWVDLAENASVRAVVLTGAGTNFSAGGDVKDMLTRAEADPGGGSGISPASARRLVFGMLDFEKPVVAAVEGRAHGLGATIALLCDLVVAGETATFADPHVSVGLAAGDGGAAVWAVLVGPYRAKELLYLGTSLPAAEVQRLGGVNRVVPEGTALAEATGLARRVLAQPQLAVRGTKIAINTWLKAQFDTLLEVALGYEITTLASWDFGEALRALAAKRRPDFQGR